jgi:hypothetical protein
MVNDIVLINNLNMRLEVRKISETSWKKAKIRKVMKNKREATIQGIDKYFQIFKCSISV